MPKDTTKPLNAGLVAVPNRMAGGFDIYMTGGQFEPGSWLHGTLYGSRYWETLEALRFAAKCDGRKLVRHADYYQLQPVREA